MWERFLQTPLWIYLKPPDPFAHTSHLCPPPPPHPSECQEKPANSAPQALHDVQLTPSFNKKNPTKHTFCTLWLLLVLSLKNNLVVIICASGLDPEFSALCARSCRCVAAVRWRIHLCVCCSVQCKPAVTPDLWLIWCCNAGMLGKNQSCRKLPDGCYSLHKCSYCNWIFNGNLQQFSG